MQTRDFVDVAARSRELGCRVPARVALLPGNFAAAANTGEFHYHAAAPLVRSAWRRVGLEDEGPHARDMTPSAGHDRNSSGIPDRVPSECALVAFFGSGLLTGPEWCLAVALGLVSRVLALHPACASPWEVRFHAVVDRPGTHGCVCIEYQGDAFGIVALCRDVRRIWTDDESIPRQEELAVSREQLD
jgi:hypothetical protein